MNDSKNGGTFSVLISWLLIALQWSVSHWSIVLSASCGVAALVASVYSILVNRAKLRALNSQNEALRKSIINEDGNEV